MRKALLTLILLLGTLSCFAGPIDSINCFYTTSIKNLIDGRTEELISLKNRTLSPACLEKLDRIVSITNCDPLLRSQDVNSDMLESIFVQDVGNNWYIVSYYWDRTKRTSLVKIPLKAYVLDNKLIITHVTPEWNHDDFGDSTIRKLGEGRITYSTGLEFVRSFYNLYLSIYCAMGEKVYDNLDKCRSHYFTDRAINDFKEKEAEYGLDGDIYYDLLIDNFDFDVKWYESMTITQTGDMYNVKYYDGNMHSVDVVVKKSGGRYYIDHLSKNSISPFNPLFSKQ